VIGINFYINPVRAAFLERSFDFSCERYTWGLQFILEFGGQHSNCSKSDE
jgi:hypothetical protein